jgi:hypothetical protein
VIGDELGRLRNPVLRRRMFTTPTDRQMMARGMPSGIMNSGPEIANAAMRPNPFIQQGMVTPRKVSTVTQPDPSLAFGMPDETDPDTSIGGDPISPTPDIIVEPAPEPPAPPASTTTTAASTKPKPKPKSKISPRDEVDEILNLIEEKRGTSSKTRKERFKEAKDFLAEVGMTEAKDVRTDRDMLMMIGGLKFAMGYGTGSKSQDAVSALNDVLGIYVGGKQAEREEEKALGLAAAKQAFSEEEAERSRLAKLDEIEIAAIAKGLEEPDKLKMARALMAEDDSLTLSQAMAEVNARSGSSSASLEILSTIKRDFPGIKGAFLRAINSAGGLRYVIENMTPEAIAANLGEDYNTPEGKAKVDAFMGLTAPPADVDGTPNDSTGGSGITVTPVG